MVNGKNFLESNSAASEHPAGTDSCELCVGLSACQALGVAAAMACGSIGGRDDGQEAGVWIQDASSSRLPHEEFILDIATAQKCWCITLLLTIVRLAPDILRM